MCFFCFFFFQAEDGIRDIGVTGVQTCALPILVVYSSLWVLLVVACGTLPQRGSMSSAMSAPRTRTNETLGRLQRSAQTQPLGHGASPYDILSYIDTSLTSITYKISTPLQLLSPFMLLMSQITSLNIVYL